MDDSGWCVKDKAGASERGNLSTEKIHISEGSQHGDIMRLRAKGIPRLGGLGRGDQVIILDVLIPTRLSRKQQDLLREFANSEIPERQEKQGLTV